MQPIYYLHGIETSQTDLPSYWLNVVVIAFDATMDKAPFVVTFCGKNINDVQHRRFATEQEARKFAEQV